MRLGLPAKLGLAVVIAFGLLFCALLLYKPLQIRYHITKFNSPDIKVRVTGVDALLELGEKGREALARVLPGGSEVAELLIKAWNYPDPALDTDADINSRDLSSKPVSESALLQAARNEFAETVRLILAKHGCLKNDYAIIFTNRGIDYRANGDNETALAYYNLAMITDPKYKWPYNNRANIKTDLKDYKGALRDYDIAVRLEPGDSTVHANRGNLKRLMKDYRSALEDCNKAVALDNGSDLARRNRIAVYVDMLDLENALPDLDKRVKDAPSDSYRYIARGYVLFDSAKFAESIADFRKIIEMRGKWDHQALYAFFRTYLANMRLGNFTTMREWAQEYMVDFKSSEVWTKTLMNFFAGEFSNAELIALAGKVKDRTTAQRKCEAYYYVAEMRLAAGDIESAKRLYEKCIATKVTTYTEYRSSRCELKRLAEREKE
jgi:lipoprotein NlpI